MHRVATPLYQHALAERDAVNENSCSAEGSGSRDLTRESDVAQHPVVLFGRRRAVNHHGDNGKFDRRPKLAAMNLFT